MFNLSFGTTTKTLLAVSLASLLLTACGGDKPADSADKTETKAETTEAKQGEAATVSETAAADPTEKLNAYIECANQGLKDGHKSYNHYAQWVDMTKGVTGNEKLIHGTFEIGAHAIDSCTTKLTPAIALAPAFADLDKVATSISTNFKAYADIINQIHKYYEQENYKDDKFEQGKTLHAELVKAYESFKTDSEAFDKALDEINTATQKAALAEVEKTEGKKYAYWSLATSLKAKEVVELLSEETFDVDKATALIGELETISTEYKTYTASKAEDVPPAVVAGLDMIVDDFVTASKKRLRRVRDNEAYTDDEKHRLGMGEIIAAAVDGSEAQVIDRYNRLVQRMNIGG